MEAGASLDKQYPNLGNNSLKVMMGKCTGVISSCTFSFYSVLPYHWSTLGSFCNCLHNVELLKLIVVIVILYLIWGRRWKVEIYLSYSDRCWHTSSLAKGTNICEICFENMTRQGLIRKASQPSKSHFLSCCHHKTRSHPNYLQLFSKLPSHFTAKYKKAPPWLFAIVSKLSSFLCFQEINLQ